VRIKQIEQLLKAHVVPELPGFEASERFLFHSPIPDLLHFFYFDASGFDKNVFYIEMGVLPLYVPVDNVHFTYGSRLGGSWDITEAETPEAVMKRVVAYIQHQGLPYLSFVPDPAAFAEDLELLTDLSPEDPLYTEPVAYSLILSGRFDDATEVVRDLHASEKTESDPHWPDVTAARVKRLERVLAALEQDPQEAVDVLRMWRLESLANLKLLEYASDYAAEPGEG
jgi:hypothetical protein